MKSVSSSTLCCLRSIFLALSLSLVALIVVTTGCGSGASSTTSPPSTSNTEVTVVLSSTADDRLEQFYLQLQSLTMTSQSGKTITIFSSPSLQQDNMFTELIHVNGLIDPLLTLNVPPDVYTAATATIGYAQFSCSTITPPQSADPGDLFDATFSYGQTPHSDVTVNLPSPITITGDSMMLDLNLQVLQSASFPSGCYYTVSTPQFSITPTFNLTPLEISTHPTNPNNGKVLGLDGEISALSASGSSLTLTLPFQEGSRALTVTTNGSTVYQGSVTSFSELAMGTFLDMDGTVQPDGSLVASRIEVEDPSAINAMNGPLQSGPKLGVTPVGPVVALYGIEQQGPGASNELGGGDFDFSQAVFNISGQQSNLQSLPFVPSFDSANIVAGQNVYVTMPTLVLSGDHFTPLNTITLIPQTINATVMASSPEGSFTDYTVLLASYDNFPTFAVQQGQTTLLTDPSQVEVYVDSSTQMLNTQTLVVGSTFRFYGLIFNDNGTLRMDCAQVNDGVTATSQSGSNTIIVTYPWNRDIASSSASVVQKVQQASQ